MDQVKNKKKAKKKKQKTRGPFIAIIIIILYFISRMPPLFGASTQNTYAAEYGKIEKTIGATGYVAREEKVIRSAGKGEIKYFVSEGERVAKGQKVAEVYLDLLDERSKKDLEIINLRLQNIKDKQDENNIFHGDTEKLDQQISVLIKSVQKDLKDGKYDRISLLKEDLDILLDKKSIIVGEKSFSGKNINQLEQQKNQLENKVNSSVQIIYSESPGFVAIGSDGFEELLNYKTLQDINSGQLDLLKDAKLNMSNKNSEEEMPVIRIIENYKWSIIAELNANDAKGMEKGQSVKLRLENQSRELSATIRSVTEEDDKKIIIFDLGEYVDNFYNLRVVTLNIIQNQYEGVMILNTSIVEKDGIEGVYTVDINGIANFVPIKIKTSNLEYSIVYDGYFERKSKDDPEKTEKISTINLYDEVVSKGSKIKEGQRVR